MAATLLQLSLLMMTVIALTSSQPTVDDATQDNDVRSCGSNEQVLRQLVTSNSQLHAAVSQLVTTVYQLTSTNSQLQSTVSQLQRDVAELKTGGRQTNTSSKLWNIISFLIEFADHNFSSSSFRYF